MKKFFALFAVAVLFVACSGNGADVIDDMGLDDGAEEIDHDASTDSLTSESKLSSSREGTESGNSSEREVKSSSSEQSLDTIELVWGAAKESFFNPNVEYGTMTDDRDGKVYKTVKIGNQVWMAENLNYDDSIAMPSLKGKMLDCGSKVGNCAVAGRMYGWTAAIDSVALSHNKENPQYCGDCCLPPRVQGVCPNGWHLPDFDEWRTLEATVRNTGNLKSNSGWINISCFSNDSCKSTDAYGFSAVAFGSKEDSSFAGDKERYVWGGFGERAVFQAANVDGYGSGYIEIYVRRGDLSYASYRRWGGEVYASVRCLKDDGPAPKAEETRLNPNVAYDSLIDERDGHVYKTVKIGALVWMADNLNYDDGKSKCFNDDEGNCEILGRLYAFNAADSGCPAGWRLPEESEWWDLFKDGSGYEVINDVKSQSGFPRDEKGSNATGFSALSVSYWSTSWNSDIYSVDFARDAYWLTQKEDDVNSVRCIKDGTIEEIKTNTIQTDVTYGSLVDERDGKVYKTVKIGEQTWMAENLNYDDSVATPSLKGKTWCYDDLAENCDSWGRLYTWAATIDSVMLATDADNPQYCGYRNNKCFFENLKGICPSGWHLPNNEEWFTLYSFVGGASIAGWILKSSTGWANEMNGSDAYGFSALPAGKNLSTSKLEFYGGGRSACFWSSEEEWGLDLGGVQRDSYCFAIGTDDRVRMGAAPKYYAQPVRCIKDSPTE